jgi:hypothetical protein
MRMASRIHVVFDPTATLALGRTRSRAAGDLRHQPEAGRIVGGQILGPVSEHGTRSASRGTSDAAVKS